MSRIPVRTIALSNADCIQIQNGIAQIDAGREITVDNKNVRRGYKLDTDIRYALARIGTLIKPVIEAWSKANEQLFKDCGSVTETDKDGKDELRVPTDKLIEYKDALAELLEKKTTLELPLVSLKNLKVGDEKDQNPIPSSALTNLQKVLDLTGTSLDLPDDTTNEEPEG
jgi:hypothetical protein